MAWESVLSKDQEMTRPTAVNMRMNPRLFATAVEKFGNLDIGFANAPGKTSLATFEQVLRTNLTGVSFTIQAAAPETEQQVPRRQS